MDAKKILIVDDEDQIRGVVADFLEDEGFLVTQAATGKDRVLARCPISFRTSSCSMSGFRT